MQPIQTNSLKRKADVAVDALERPGYINRIPSDVIMQIFYLIALTDIHAVGKCASICKRWRLVTQHPLIQQLVVQRFYVQLMTTEDVAPRYYVEAASFAKKLNQLSLEFAGNKKSILVYGEYRKNLTKALEQSDLFYDTLPYFDMRPLGWLQPKHWEDLFATFALRLKGVQVLQISGMGCSIDFHKLETLHIPVASEAFKVSRMIAKDLKEIFFPEKTSDKTEVANRLVICIGAIAAASKKLTTLIADNTCLDEHHMRIIFRNIPTINRVYYYNRKEMSCYQLKRDHPDIKFLEKPS